MFETVRPYASPIHLRVAIFDFDGTLSLIRSGWMQMMTTQFVRELRPLSPGEDEEALRRLSSDLILRLTGKETIHQMEALVEQMRMRGGHPASAAEYKTEFLEQLMAVATERFRAVQSGSIAPDAMLVPGARAVLELLRAHGIELYLASGTDDENLQQEARVLDIARYFGENIYGARLDGLGFTKAALVRHLVTKAGYAPGELAAFGDGYVEVHEVSEAGGVTVGLATDEPECLKVDEAKREYLITAGANYIVPNYLGIDSLVERFLPADMMVRSN